MNYLRLGQKIVMKLAIGEGIKENLISLAEKEDIRAAEVTGLGAVDRVDLAFYHLNTQNYENHQIEEGFEVLSLMGNLTMNQGKYHPHLHIVLGRKDLSTIGGHLNEAYTSVTMEITVTILEGAIERSLDETVSLDLMNLD